MQEKKYETMVKTFLANTFDLIERSWDMMSKSESLEECDKYGLMLCAAMKVIEDLLPEAESLLPSYKNTIDKIIKTRAGAAALEKSYCKQLGITYKDGRDINA